MVAHALRSFRRLLQGGLPFSLRHALALRPGLCCSRPPKRTPIWTVRTYDRPFPRFHVAPCSLQLGLSSALRQRPSCATNLPTICRHINATVRRLLSFVSSGAGIRTPTLRSKVCCPTVRRPRIARRDSYYTAYRCRSQSCLAGLTPLQGVGIRGGVARRPSWCISGRSTDN
jgi:hypothetical protein